MENFIRVSEKDAVNLLKGRRTEWNLEKKAASVQRQNIRKSEEHGRITKYYRKSEEHSPTRFLKVLMFYTVKIKIALEHIQIDGKRDIFSSSVFTTSERERKDVNFRKQAQQMINEKHARIKEDTHAFAKCFADAIAGDPICRAALEMEADTLNEAGETILHVESKKGVIENVRFIVSAFANKNLLVRLDNQKQTALYLAAHHGHTQVVEALLDAARRNLPSSSSNDDTQNPVTPFQAFIRQATGPMQNTALHLAVLNGNVAIVKLIVGADPNDSHIQNNEGKTPIYIAAEKGYRDIVKEICMTCTALSLDGPHGRTTALHALIQNIGQVENLDGPDGSCALHAAITDIDKGKEEDRDLIMITINAAKYWSLAEGALHASFEALFDRPDESGSTPIELAMYRNHLNTVELILLEDPAYQDGHGSKFRGLVRLIHQAIENEYSDDIVQLLSQTFKAGINLDLKGLLDLIIAIQGRDADFVLKLLEGDNGHVLSFVDSEGWTPLHYAAYHEFDYILRNMIDAQKTVGYQFVYEDKVATPYHVAAKRGHTSTLLRLLELWPASAPSPYTTVDENGQNILHLAAVDNKKKMVNGILRYCPPRNKDKLLTHKDSDGNTPLHLLVSNGCFIPDLIKYMTLHTMSKNKKSWTPRDMLYFQDNVVGDQAEIKMALEEVYRKCRPASIKENTDSSFVLPSRRDKKDIIFNEYEKLLIDAKNAKMKKELQRYRQGTNNRIVVSALITTITFTVGFTMPGGLHQSGESNEGLAVLSKKKAFKAFMILDAVALLLSIFCLIIYFLESMSQDLDQVT